MNCCDAMVGAIGERWAVLEERSFTNGDFNGRYSYEELMSYCCVNCLETIPKGKELDRLLLKLK